MQGHTSERLRAVSGGLLVALAVCAVAVPATARASFPGGNGDIYFAGRDVDTPSSIDLWRVHPDGDGLRKLTDRAHGPAEGFDPSVSKKVTRVAFTVGSQATSDVWIMRPDGSSPKQLTTSPPTVPVQGLDQMPGISPNGRRIAFMTTRETDPMASGLDYNIWMMRSDGSRQKQLLDTTAEDYFPEFTPDGRSVVLASEVTGDLDIAMVPIAGAPHTSATALTGYSNVVETTPTVAPDGESVAFVRRDSSQPFDRQLDVLSVPVGSSTEQPIATDDQINETSPAYSPNGRKIAYVTPSGAVIADADGSDPAPLRLNPNRVFDPAELEWAPKKPRG